MKQSRRDFISAIASAGAVLPFISKTDFNSGFSASGRYPVRLFSKPLDSYDFDFMCECLVKSGIEGFDLTVRPGGKVEPSSVDTILPRLVEEAGKYKLKIDMMVTGILSVTDPFAEQVLKTASFSGVKYYRLGWFQYEKNSDILQTLEKDRILLREIAELNRKYKIHGGYQNHSGAGVGGPVWDLHELLRDLPPEYLGSQYDVRHAMVEGANTWVLGMRLIADHIRTLAVKDFTWRTVNGKPEAVTVPLGEGMVDWDTFFTMIKELNITGPITLHVEYPLLENGEEKLPLIRQQEIIVKKLSKDVDFLNGYLDKYNLS